MRQNSGAPSGVERTFDPDEIIVTKTDLQGRIQYANDVFCRVSAFTEEQVLGQPHSMIRHPDMPRCIFELLWSTIKGGHEIFAYVVNLAGDGAHYWVLAHVTPSIGANGQILGYHSNRRVPSRAALDQIQPLYRSLVATEKRHQRPADAIAASRAQLEEHLAAAGQTYDEMVWSLAGTHALTGRTAR